MKGQGCCQGRRHKGKHNVSQDNGDISTIEQGYRNNPGWEMQPLCLSENKVQICIRLDKDIIEWFQKQGPGYQRRINAVLKSYVNAHTQGQNTINVDEEGQ